MLILVDGVLRFINTVSAMSSALCPVTTCFTPSLAAPRSSACRLNTPQYVQFPFLPTCSTTWSIVHPYNSLYPSMVKSMPYCSAFLFTVSRLSSL
jgi:hypothetical protein